MSERTDTIKKLLEDSMVNSNTLAKALDDFTDSELDILNGDLERLKAVIHREIYRRV